MSVECQVCARKCQIYLCTQCERDLKSMLLGLTGRTMTNTATGENRAGAGWLELLEDSALGCTRLGESARRSSEQNSPMPCNLAASELYNDLHAMLTRWAETISLQTETLTGQ